MPSLMNGLMNGSAMRIAILAGLCLAFAADAGVLPDDRADVLYHRYQGGGVTIDGPSVLVRKKIGQSFSAAANYYVDMVSSASIDVQLTASPYKEKRTQKSLSVDYLRGKSTYTVSVIGSSESDYDANTASFGISQDMFGDLTTVSIGYRRGWDDVRRRIRGTVDPTFDRKVDRRAYTVGISQVLTRNALLTLNFETQTDEGFLNSPYRSVRYLDPTVPRGFSFESERYPDTHSSNAVSARVKYFLPWRAAADGTYRFYDDTWGIRAHTLEIAYTQPAWRNWTFDGRMRYYRQNAADFYADLFPRRNFANFLARDKELATYQSWSAGVGATYEFRIARVPWVQKSTVNLRYDFLHVGYDDFRDARLTNPTAGIGAGNEPLYSLNANVIQLFLSVWY